MKIILAIMTILLLLAAYGIYLNVTAPKLGVENGKLAPCPNRPNCVSSQAEKKLHSIEPLPLSKKGLGPIKKIIENDPNAKIVSESEVYLRAEFRTALGFRDDVEFLINRDQEVIEVRSASRVGYNDLDVNRKRIEIIRNRIMADE